ncbi:RIP metalloprotease RseP [Brevibacillus dissolubilis]|uniref:RIP metalloprotease RseP n=1 Tax=Brevibacillus dissolubilis TaxID=1844116 RepID=UPI0011160E4F|nr:RIP metalloprotease RseP [Brevibacillus dissolubilis]
MIVVFGVLVFVHELGHFLLARRAGILCREFALGMGPRIFSVKRGETEYTLRLLPIGGLVRMAGEDPEMDVLKPHMEVGLELGEHDRVKRILVNEPRSTSSRVVYGTLISFDLEKQLTILLEQEGESRTYHVDPQAMLVNNGQEAQIAPLNRQFRGKTVSQRFWAIFAGPAANFLLAFVLLTGAAMAYGIPSNEPIIGEVVAGGPAAQAGLRTGDRVLSINGSPVSTWEQVAVTINQSPGKQLNLVVSRNGEELKIPVTPVTEDNVGKIKMTQVIEYSFVESIKYGGMATYDFTMMILTGLGKLVTGGVGLNELSGPAGILQMTGHFATKGFEVLIRWTAVLSVNLGLFNLLPLPALDGGRLVFLGIEALRGRPVDPNKEGLVHFVGFAFLMLLIVVVTWNDIQRLFFQN